MREIKFRGKHLVNNEWIYGSLIVWPDGDTSIYNAINTNKNEMGRYDVRPSTIGHFTGLYDCEGNEIYEGDILTAPNVRCMTFEVKWNDDIAAFCARFYFENEVGIRPIGDWQQGYAFKKLGNIYDDPELLSPQTKSNG